MSSEEDTAPQSHTEARERPVRNRHTPKHLEDYILAYRPHEPALSSHADDEEQRPQPTVDKRMQVFILGPAKVRIAPVQVIH